MTLGPDTSTSYERFSLLSGALNLSDGHARQPLTPSQQEIIQVLPDIFREAATRPQSELENSFISSFFSLAGQRLESSTNIPLLAYSASSSINMVANWCRQNHHNVGLIEPCFDNIPKLLRSQGVNLLPVPESILDESANLEQIVPIESDVVWIVTPNNPTGRNISEKAFRSLVEYCVAKGLVLVCDFCFRFFDEPMLGWDQHAILRQSGVTYIVIEDTGKTWATLDMKIGITASSQDVYDDMYQLHDDLLLNVSPFHLVLLDMFVNDTIVNGIINTIRPYIDVNRHIVNRLYELPEFSRGSDYSENGPFEWVRVNPPNSAREIYRKLSFHGIHVLPGHNFYWFHVNEGDSFLRIPLSRDPEIVSRGMERIRSVVHL